MPIGTQKVIDYLSTMVSKRRIFRDTLQKRLVSQMNTTTSRIVEGDIGVIPIPSIDQDLH
jgi:hypothetical protein